MNCLNRKYVVVLLGAACVLAPVSTAHADDSKVPKLATLEQQVDYLISAASDGIRSLDLKMLSLAAEGLKKARLAGKDLEIAALRAERDAAMTNGFGAFGMGMGAPQQIYVMGQVLRARAGDTRAIDTLRAWGTTDIPVVKPPDFTQLAGRPAETLAAQKAYRAYSESVARKHMALLGIAILNEPGATDKALAAIKALDEGNPATGMGPNVDPLVMAALFPDGKSGLKPLIELCSDDKTPVAIQLAVMGVIIRLSPDNGGYKSPEMPFTLTGDFQNALPKDTLVHLAKPLAGVIRRYTPPAGNAYDNTLNTILNLAATFPAKSFDADGIAALQTLKTRISGPNASWMQQSLAQILKKQDADSATNPAAGTSAAQKPPSPPRDF